MAPIQTQAPIPIPRRATRAEEHGEHGEGVHTGACAEPCSDCGGMRSAVDQWQRQEIPEAQARNSERRGFDHPFTGLGKPQGTTPSPRSQVRRSSPASPRRRPALSHSSPCSPQRFPRLCLNDDSDEGGEVWLAGGRPVNPRRVRSWPRSNREFVDGSELRGPHGSGTSTHRSGRAVVPRDPGRDRPVSGAPSARLGGEGRMDRGQGEFGLGR